MRGRGTAAKFSCRFVHKKLSALLLGPERAGLRFQEGKDPLHTRPTSGYLGRPAELMAAAKISKKKKNQRVDSLKTLKSRTGSIQQTQQNYSYSLNNINLAPSNSAVAMSTGLSA